MNTTTLNKHIKRAEAIWNPEAPPKPPRAKTPHDVAVAYAARGWVGVDGKRCASRSDWESSIRYHGSFTLPKEATP